MPTYYGHRFTFRTDPVPNVGFDGVVHCEVLEVDPQRLLRTSWSGGFGMHTTVTWRLRAEGRGMRSLRAILGAGPARAERAPEAQSQDQPKPTMTSSTSS